MQAVHGGADEIDVLRQKPHAQDILQKYHKDIALRESRWLQLRHPRPKGRRDVAQGMDALDERGIGCAGRVESGEVHPPFVSGEDGERGSVREKVIAAPGVRARVRRTDGVCPRTPASETVPADRRGQR